MVLPSQTIRPPAIRRTGHRSLRRGRRGRWPLWIAIAAVAAILIIAFWRPQQPEAASVDSQRVNDSDVVDATSATTRMPPNALVLDDEGDREADSMPRLLAISTVEADQPSGISDVPAAVGPDRPLSVEPLWPTTDKSERTDQDPSRALPITEDRGESARPSVVVEIAADPGVDFGPAPVETAHANVQAPKAAQKGGLGRFRADIGSARALIAQGKDLEARHVPSRILNGHGHRLSMAESHTVRLVLNEVNDKLLLSRAMVPGDQLVAEYTVRRGDKLIHIGLRHKVPYTLIMRMNGINDPTRMRFDSRIKVPRGPFHAILTKRAFRMDVYAKGSDDARIFVYSFAVGLGAGDSTPDGQWIVRRGKKEDPDWLNPQTNQYFAKGDLKNPIGEHWIPIKGIDHATRELHGFGIHGTIDPESIGKQESMGCVRMLPDDVALLYEMLAEDESRVTIRP